MAIAKPKKIGLFFSQITLGRACNMRRILVILCLIENSFLEFLSLCGLAIFDPILMPFLDEMCPRLLTPAHQDLLATAPYEWPHGLGPINHDPEGRNLHLWPEFNEIFPVICWGHLDA